MEEVTKATVEPTGSMKKYVIIGVIVLAVILLLSRGGGGNTEETITELESLQAINEELEAQFDNLGSDKKATKEFLSQADGFLDRLEKQIDIHVAFANKVDITDEEEFGEFVERHDLITDLAPSKSECGMIGDLMSMAMEMFSEAGSYADKFGEIYERQCELAEPLFAIDIDRDSSKIEVADEYEQIESVVVPSGYSFIAQRPEQGLRETVTLTIDGEERGTNEVITKEATIGKKVSGAGNPEEVAESIVPLFEMLMKQWSEQQVNRENLVTLFGGSNDDEDSDASSGSIGYAKVDESGIDDVVSRYESVAFNWSRFEGTTPKPEEATFKDVSGNYGSKYSMVVTLPFEAPYLGKDEAASVSFYYMPQNDSWGITPDTYNTLFDVIDDQYIPAAYSPSTVVYNESDTCKDSWGFVRANGIKITDVGIAGQNKFFINAGYQGPSQLFVQVPGKTTVSEVTGYGSSQFYGNTPQSVIEYFNDQRGVELKITEFNNNKCNAAPNMEVEFFKEQPVEDIEEEN